MKRPSFQFYPKDWLADEKIGGMTAAQEGAYLRILCYMWQTEECQLDKNVEYLMRISRLSNEEDLRVVALCLQPKGDFYTSKRLQAERRKQDEWIKKSIIGGKKSAEMRATRQKNNFKGGSRVVQPPYQPNGNSSSSSSNTSSIEDGETPPPQETEKKDFGNQEINRALEIVKEKTGMPAVGKNHRFHLSNLLKKLKKEYPDIDPLVQFETLVVLTLKINDKILTPRVNDIPYLYYHWPEVVSIAKQKRRQNSNSDKPKGTL